MSQLRVKWLGRNVPYNVGMAAMQHAIDAFADPHAEPENTLFLLEHQSTITATTQGGDTFLKTDVHALARDQITWAHASRGGDVTFHGPGQLVGYPVIRLPFLPDPPAGRVDILKYLRTLEKSLMLSCRDIKIKGVHTQKDRTGIWITDREPEPIASMNDQDASAKMIAIGVGVKRGITRHGFAFNLHTDIEHFTKHIVPCGLENKRVTSLERVLSRQKIDKMPTLPNICKDIAIHFATGLGLKPPYQADFDPIPASLSLNP